MSTVKTEWKNLLKRLALSESDYAEAESQYLISGRLTWPERLLMYRYIFESFEKAKLETKLFSKLTLAAAISS